MGAFPSVIFCWGWVGCVCKGTCGLAAMEKWTLKWTLKSPLKTTPSNRRHEVCLSFFFLSVRVSMEHESESKTRQWLRSHALVFWLVHFLHSTFFLWRRQTQYIHVIIRRSVVSLGLRNIHAYKHSPKVGNLRSRSCTRIHCLWLLRVWWPQDAPVSENEKLMKT